MSHRIPHEKDFWTWSEWQLGHGRFKQYGPRNHSVRPHLFYGGHGQAPVPQVWRDEFERRFVRLLVRLPLRHMDVSHPSLGPIFSLRGIFVSNSEAMPDPQTFVKRAAGSGYRRIALQVAEVNEPYIARWHAACDLYGVVFGIWDDIFTTGRRVLDHVEAIRRYGAAFTILDVESGDYGWFASGLRETLPSVPAAVTISGDPALGTWIAFGYPVLTQAYMQESDHWSPAELDFHYYQMYQSLEVTVPVLGVYHNYPISNYNGKLLQKNGQPSPTYWVYLGDAMQDTDWIIVH